MKKIIALLTIVLSLFTVNFSVVEFASAKTNKEVVIEQFETLISSFTELKSDKAGDLWELIATLNKKYDALFTNLGYDSKTIDYLNSLEALNTNFKDEIVKDYNRTNTSIENTINAKMLEISNLKNQVTFAYSSINETKKTELEGDIGSFANEYQDIKEDIERDIQNLKNEYETKIEQHSKELAKALSAAKVDLGKINSFVASFDELEKAIIKFQRLYDTFEENYLTYLGDINQTISDKKEEYSDKLDSVLSKTLTSNIIKYKTLEGYETEGKSRIKEIVTNFKFDLTNHLNSTYYIVYSQSDMEAILNEYKVLKNKYFDSEGNVKSKEVVANKNFSTQFQNYASKVKKANKAMEELMEWDKDETLKNIQTEIENNIIDFFNDNAEKYLNAFKDAIEDKLTIRNVENNSIIALNEILELRYILMMNSFTEDMSESAIKSNVDAFKLYSNQFLRLKNSSLTRKVNQVNARLDLYIINKELAKTKYYKDKKNEGAYSLQIRNVLSKNKLAMSSDEYLEYTDDMLSKIKQVEKVRKYKKYGFLFNTFKKVILEERL